MALTCHAMLSRDVRGDDRRGDAKTGLAFPAELIREPLDRR